MTHYSYALKKNAQTETVITETKQPTWLDKAVYPFDSNYLKLEPGNLHYVDEGQGKPIVMVHGNPSWSFLYRHAIKGLRDTYRCIAPDHLGFGLSDKPEDWSYKPEDHARNLEQLINHLELEDITLVVQDWGGPIGLSYALKHPEKVSSLVIMNTWMWSVEGDPYYQRFSGFMGGAVGNFLIKNFNFFVNVLMKQVTGDISKLPKEVHQHYQKALATASERKGCSVLPKEIIGSSSWLASLWEQRQLMADKPTLLLWGMKDIAFREAEMKRWQDLLGQAEIHRFEHLGHYLQEELGDELPELMAKFLAKKP